jgi:hypothetical protein
MMPGGNFTIVSTWNHTRPAAGFAAKRRRGLFSAGGETIGGMLKMPPDAPRKGAVLNLPNLITLGRILLAPVVVWAIASNEMKAAFVLFSRSESRITRKAPCPLTS